MEVGEGRLQVFPDMDMVPEDAGPFDFVIVDGGGLDPAYFSALAHRAVVFVEGYRETQRQLLERVCSDREWAHGAFYDVRARLRNVKSGYFVYQLEPSLRERLMLAGANQWDRLGDRLKRIVR